MAGLRAAFASIASFENKRLMCLLWMLVFLSQLPCQTRLEERWGPSTCISKTVRVGDGSVSTNVRDGAYYISAAYRLLSCLYIGRQGRVHSLC